MFKAGQKKLYIVGKNKILPELVHLAKATLLTQSVAISTIAILFFITPKTEISHNVHRVVKGAATKNISLNVPRVQQSTPTPVPQTSITTTEEVSQLNDEPVLESNSTQKATQIDDVTWTVNVAADNVIGDANDIFSSLNSYREKNGRSTLIWDQRLANYAKSRADLFSTRGATDKHDGFNTYLDGNGFSELGYNSIGENSSYGYHVSGTKLIEEVYASDAPHNNNQLAEKWTHVGVGASGVATDIIFAGNKQ